MSKIRSCWSGTRFHNLLKEGRGQGVLKDYIPFIQIHDIPSTGICSRVKSATVGRVHHLLSRNELAFFYLKDFDDEVTDIREQYPLLDPSNLHDLTGIVKMADAMGIKYPRDPKNHYPYVMTTDFLITQKDGLHAYSIKESKAYSIPRIKELQEFERRYWEWLGIPWKIVTEQEINYNQVQNIQWIYNAWDIDNLFPDEKLRSEVMRYEIFLYENTGYSILKIAKEAEKYFNLKGGAGLTVFQRLLWEKRLVISIDKPLALMTPRLDKINRGEYSCSEAFL